MDQICLGKTKSDGLRDFNFNKKIRSVFEGVYFIVPTKALGKNDALSFCKSELEDHIHTDRARSQNIKSKSYSYQRYSKQAHRHEGG